jgi:hypothetical protein
MQAIEECDGHMLTRAQMLEAWAHEGYWDGVNFIPRAKDLAPLLSFLGSQKFVYMCVAAATAFLIGVQRP